ncbi:hypothetical protein BGZ73_004382 [Actinomortierella ambigua]|nr:hypothetical protein BGZ73_004382 [Actinomortierella ambigua]
MDLTGAPRTQSTTSTTNTGSNQYTPPRLGYFCVYNADFGPTEETQHEQLLYYVARKTVSIDAKMRQIGLAQGLTNFAKIFSPNAPCENVHSQKNRLVFYEAEPGYWLHMSVELGTIRRTVKGFDGQPRVLIEYQEHDLHDMALRAMLEQAYLMYRVAHGTMDSLVVRTPQPNNSNSSGFNTRPLQRRLEEFYEPLVLHWDFEGNGSGFHIATSLERALNGIHYLPLSRETYVAIDGVLKAVKAKYEAVTHAMVTFENQLVSSDIRDEDLQAVWRQILQWTGNEYWQPTFQDRQLPEKEEVKKKRGLAAGTFKFAKSWSNAGLFGFYKAATSTSASPTGSGTGVGAGAGGAAGSGSGNVSATTTPPLSPSLRPPSRVGSPAPSIHSVDGVLVGSALEGQSSIGENKTDLESLWFGQYIASEAVEEHYAIIYRHKSGLALTFFILADTQEGMPAQTEQLHPSGHEIRRKGATILEAESLARGIEELFSSHQYPSLEHYEARTQGDGNQELVLESSVEDATSTPLNGSVVSAGGAPSSPSYLSPTAAPHSSISLSHSSTNNNATNSTYGTGGSSSGGSLRGRDDSIDGDIDLSKSIEWVAKKVTEDAWTARRLGGVISNDKAIRYLYFNRMNFAVKSRLGFPEVGGSVSTTKNRDPRAGTAPGASSSAPSTTPNASKSSIGKGQAGDQLGPDVALALLDIKQDFERMPDAVEITTRSPANHWIVAKRFEDREVYMIVSRKDSSLVEVEDEVRRITSLYFSGTTLSSSSTAPPTIHASAGWLNHSKSYTAEEILALPLTQYRIPDALHDLPSRRSARHALAEAIATLLYPAHEGSMTPIIRYEEDRVRLRAWAALQRKHDHLQAAVRNGRPILGSRDDIRGDSAPVWTSRITSQGAWDPKTKPISLGGVRAIPMPVKVAEREHLAPFLTHLSQNGTHLLDEYNKGPTTNNNNDNSGVTLNDGEGEPYYGVKGAEFRKGVIYEDGRMDLCKMVVGPDHIWQLMDSLRPNEFVRHFLLGNNIIGPSGARAIANFIEELPNRMETWYLAGNCINGPSFKVLVDAMVQSPTITNIWMKRNPIGPEAAPDVFRLITQSPNLRTLDLDQVELGDEGVADLFNRLAGYVGPTDSQLPLRHLYLNGNGISARGAAAIAKFFASPHCGLTSLYMSTNPIGNEGAEALAAGLPSALTLNRLFLQSTGISTQGAIALCKALTGHPAILSLDFSQAYATEDLGQAYNYIEDAALPSLRTFVGLTRQLEYLNLGYCAITPPGVIALSGAVVENPSIMFFNAISILKDPTQPKKAAATFTPSRGLPFPYQASQGRVEIQMRKAVREHLQKNVWARYGRDKSYEQFLADDKRWLVSDRDVRKIDSVYRNRDAGLARRRLVTLVKDWNEGDNTLEKVMAYVE